MREPRTDKHGRPIADRVVAAMSWGRIAFVVVVGLAGFGTFVAGEISGARTLEPRVAALESRVAKVDEALAARAAKVDSSLSELGVKLAEITGYVKAIARTTGAEVKP